MNWRPSGSSFRVLCIANLILWLTLVAAHASTYAVPLIYDRGVYFADVDIGQRPLRCMIDTGAMYSQIDADERTRYWHPVEVGVMQDATGTRTPLWHGPTTVRIGAVTLNDVLFQVHVGKPTDCLIGQSVFERFRYVTLDREHRYLYLGD